MGGNVVATNAQDPGIQLFEPSVVTPERSSLIGSTTGEIKDVERQHHGVFAAVAVQRNIAVVWRWEREVGGNIPNLARHQPSPV